MYAWKREECSCYECNNRSFKLQFSHVRLKHWMFVSCYTHRFLCVYNSVPGKCFTFLVTHSLPVCISRFERFIALYLGVQYLFQRIVPSCLCQISAVLRIQFTIKYFHIWVPPGCGVMFKVTICQYDSASTTYFRMFDSIIILSR